MTSTNGVKRGQKYFNVHYKFYPTLPIRSYTMFCHDFLCTLSRVKGFLEQEIITVGNSGGKISISFVDKDVMFGSSLVVIVLLAFLDLPHLLEAQRRP